MALLSPACSSPAESSPVVFVDEADALAGDSGNRSVNPLLLVVEIDGQGKLSLNKIETGTIDNTTILSATLKTIFEDRQKAAIDERGVLVEMNGEVRHEDFEKLIETLSHAEAMPIRVIKGNDLGAKQ
jgi:biopolymer transport protein ExbD